MATTRNPRRVLTPEQEAEMLRKERVVLEHKLRGKGWAWIERNEGISNPDRVWKRAINRPGNEGYQRAEAIRLEEQRLDALQDGIWDKAVAGDPRAVEVAMKVLERRSRMLGLDHADALAGRLVEVEQAKVRLLASALVQSLRAAGVPEEQQRAAVRALMDRVREAAGAARDEDAPPPWRDDDGFVVVRGDVVDQDLTEEDRALL